MSGKFGAFIARKRLEKDIKLKPIAEELGISVTSLQILLKVAEIRLILMELNQLLQS